MDIKQIDNWIFKNTTPAHGRVYHSDRYIKIVYTNIVKYYLVPPDKKLLPCFGDLILSEIT